MKEQSSFLNILGDSPINKVLDFLIVFSSFDYSLTDIAKNSGVAYSTLMLFWKTLEKYKIVTFTRKVGKAKMYRLNKENPAVKQLIRLHKTICKQEVRKMLKQKIMIKT
ncbi:MAG: hypothetical protein ABIE94_02350 [archaeon]